MDRLIVFIRDKRIYDMGIDVLTEHPEYTEQIEKLLVRTLNKFVRDIHDIKEIGGEETLKVVLENAD